MRTIRRSVQGSKTQYYLSFLINRYVTDLSAAMLFSLELLKSAYSRERYTRKIKLHLFNGEKVHQEDAKLALSKDSLGMKRCKSLLILAMLLLPLQALSLQSASPARSTETADSNALATKLYQAGKITEARAVLLATDSLLAGRVTDSVSACSYFLLGKIAYRLREGEAGIAYHTKTLNWRLKHFSTPHPQLLESYEWLGNIYRYTLRKPYEAIPYYEKALNQAEVAPHPDPEALRRLTYHLSASYRLVKDLDKAFTYGQKSLRLARINKPGDPARLASHLNQIGTLYVTDNRPDEAISYFREAMEILPEGPAFFTRRMRYRSNLADAIRETGKPGTAQQLQLQNLALAVKNRASPEVLGTLYHTLAKGAVALKNVALADSFAILAQRIYQTSLGEKHTLVAEMYRYRAAIQRETPGVAVPLLDSALLILWPERLTRTKAILPEFTDWEALFTTLGHKAFTLARKSHDPAALQSSLLYHRQALEAYRRYRFNYLTASGIIAQSRQHAWLLEEALQTVHQALAIKHDPVLLSFAWEIVETGKSALMQQRIRSVKAGRESILPDSLLDQYRHLLYKREVYSASKQHKDSLYYTARQLTKWKAHVLAKFPLYGRLLLQYASSEEVTAKIPQNYGLLNFWEGKENLYAISYRQGKAQLYKINKDSTFNKHYHRFTAFIRDPAPELLGKSQVRESLESGFYLYRQLVARAFDHPPAGLVVIPHGRLENLAFSALLTAPVHDQVFSFHTFPYLVHNSAVSYAFSGTQYLHSMQQGQQQSGAVQMTGIAWGNRHQKGNFFPLPASEKEVKQAVSLWGGQFLGGAQATETGLRNKLLEKDVIHLALHGTALPEEPSLVFPATDSLQDNRLYLSEIYGLNIQSRAVILSACQTAQGMYAAGEGTLSIARGFAYSGCPVVISSLWPLYDGSTANMMTTWHKYAHNGTPLDIALQNSKKLYLSRASPLEGHPSYWAATILTGSNHSLNAPKVSYLHFLLIAGGAAALLLTLFFLRSFNKSA